MFDKPGMPPLIEQAPKEIMNFDFFRNSFAMCSFSAVRMAPLKKHTSIWLSGSASMSLYLVSMATGQKTMSAASTTSRICSLMSRTAISQPPQLAAQYNAICSFFLDGLFALVDLVFFAIAFPCMVL